MPSYIQRALNLDKDLKSKSVFLLGPRQTGKSSFIREQVPNHRLFNLLLPEVYNRLSFNPQALVEQILDNKQIVVIDEIQKLPSLLDVVHYLIEEKKVRFLLTGSSARKIKSTQMNLLGGRARIRHLHPFTFRELGGKFDLDIALHHGLLPGHYFSDDINADLDSYIGVYLQQEIANEGLTRNVPAFSRFLEIAALGHGERINFSKISNEAQIPRTTIHEYYQIMQDTLIAHEVPAWRASKKRRAVATAKYYFFDWGIVRRLQKISSVARGSPLFGKAFESFLFQEIKAYCDHKGISGPQYWRTTAQDEVDFIINDEIAVEIKGKAIVNLKDAQGLVRLKEEKLLKFYYLVYDGQYPMTFPEAPGIQVLPWRDFLARLWET